MTQSSAAPGSEPEPTPEAARLHDITRPPVYFARGDQLFSSGGEDDDHVMVLDLTAYSHIEQHDLEDLADGISSLLNAERDKILAFLAEMLISQIMSSIVGLPMQPLPRQLQLASINGMVFALTDLLGYPGRMDEAKLMLQKRGIAVP